MDSTAPLVLILAGPAELRRKLSLCPLEALRQRLTVAYHVRALTAEETTGYVTHRLHQVAIDRPVFTDSALDGDTAFRQSERISCTDLIR